MTVGIAATLANADLNRLRNVVASAIAAVYVQLHTADPTTGGSAVSAGSTTRNAITWNAAAGGSMSLLTLAGWTNGGTTETLTHVSLWDAASAGNFLHSFVMGAPQSWVNTNTFTISAFTVSRTPLAA